MPTSVAADLSVALIMFVVHASSPPLWLLMLFGPAFQAGHIPARDSLSSGAGDPGSVFGPAASGAVDQRPAVLRRCRRSVARSP